MKKILFLNYYTSSAIITIYYFYLFLTRHNHINTLFLIFLLIGYSLSVIYLIKKNYYGYFIFFIIFIFYSLASKIYLFFTLYSF